MNNVFQTKLRLLFIPYLLYCAGIVCLYTFLNWLLFTQWQLWLLKEEVKDLWIPFALPWIPLAIGFPRRLRLLKYKEKAKSPVFGMVLLLGFAIIAPLIIAQSYLSTAAGKLTDLNQVNEITQKAETRYYRIRDYIIDRGYTRTHFKRAVSGKYNQYLDLSLYIICPMYDSGMVPKTDIRHYPISDDHRLYFLNGSVSDSLTIMKIPREKIAAADVIKGAAALSKYGIAGKNGVILITSLDPDSMQTKNATSSLPDSIKLMPQDEPTKITGVRHGASFYPLAWIGVKYYKEISNRLDADAKKQKIMSFVDQSWLDYVQLPVKDFTYFDEIPYNDDYTEYQKAADNSVRFRPGSHLRLLLSKTEPFENRNGSKLPWIFGSFAIGAAVYLLILSFIPFDEAKLKAWLGGYSAIGAIGTSSGDPGTQRQAEKGNKNPLQVFTPRKGFVATPVIICLNIAVFIAMVIGRLGFIDFSANDLAEWGGNYGPYTSDGQWWRLLTSVFLHGGLMHLLLNMYALLFVGIFLEPILGRNRFAVCYLLTGIMSSFASYKIHPALVAVGASGAIFGMYGIFLAFLLTGAFPPGMKKAFLASTLIFIGYNLIMGLSGNVDNAAHIGGLVSGFVVGLLLSGRVKGEKADNP